VRKFRVDGTSPCHDYNVTAALCPRQQWADQLAQTPLDSIPNHGVAQLPADGQADPGPANLIIAYEQGEVLGRRPAA